MPKHSNDNDTPHVILEEDRAGNVRPVLAPLPEAVPFAGTGPERGAFEVWRDRYDASVMAKLGAAAMRRRAA